MKWVGLTGCMGCGKSTVAKILKENFGYPVISADEVALKILKTDLELHQFIEHDLGIEFDSNYDSYRSKISAKIFGNSELLKKYEEYFHPKVKLEVNKIKTKLAESSSMAFYDVPLLFEKNMQADFAAIVGVFADKENQINRLKERNQWTESQIENRLKHHMSNTEKIKMCDLVIYNDSTEEDLKLQIQDILVKLNSH
jgi:dephospho-CoA kinase